MTVLTLQPAPIRARRLFWEPWLAAIGAAALYLRVANGQWGGFVALGAELLIAVVMRSRLQQRAEDELALAERLLARELVLADVDRLIGSAAERIQSMFATASNAVLAVGMAASAFLLLFYAAGAGNGIVSVAPKAFVATGYAILCALALTRDAHHLTATVLDPLRRSKLEGSRDPAAPAVEPLPAAEDPSSRSERLIEQLVAMQIQHLQAMNETNSILNAAASERVDEDSGTVRVKLAKGLTDFRKSVDKLDVTVQSLNTRLDALASEESVLLDHHRRELVGEVSRLPEVIVDRTAGLIGGTIGRVEDRFLESLRSIHDDETRHARDLLTSEFKSLRDQFHMTEKSVDAIALRFNEVISSLDALASAFDRSAKSVVASAADFTRESESLVVSVTTALAGLERSGDAKASLLTPLTEAATAVRKASTLVATDLRKVTAERERLGRVRMKILELLPNEAGN
jgi:hypothetical protein